MIYAQLENPRDTTPVSINPQDFIDCGGDAGENKQIYLVFSFLSDN